MSPQEIDVRRVKADDLRYLAAVARTGSRAVAADDIGVDTSTVTRRIRALEQALGVRLVEIGAQGWALTDTGRRIAGLAAPIETAVAESVAAAAGHPGSTLRGSIRVSAPDAFGAYFVSPALTNLRRDHPAVTIELLTTTRQLNLYRSGFDVAIAVGSTASSSLASEPLTDYALRLYAARTYLADHGEPACLSDLAAHPLVWYVDSMLQLGDLELEKHFPGASARVMSTSVFGQVEATRAGAGIGLLPAFVAGRHPDLVRVLPHEVDIRLQYSLASRRDRLTSPTVQAIRSAIGAEVASRTAELLPPS